MTAFIKHPGGYLDDTPAFPNHVVEVATAVPAFIGYTETATYESQDLTNKPWRISSMGEYLACFGGPPSATALNITPPLTFRVSSTAPTISPAPARVFTVTSKDGKTHKDYFVFPAPGTTLYLLYSSMLLFFQNGGGNCYIVSVGSYKDQINADKLTAGIDLLTKEQEPTMVVIPDAVRLADIDAFTRVQAHAVRHCGEIRSRIAILDIYEGYKELADSPVSNFRDNIPINNLDMAAAYYPWLETTVLGDDLITPSKYISTADLTALVTNEGIVDPNVFADLKDNTGLLDRTLSTGSHAVAQALADIKRQLNRLPPSPAIAGVCTMVDNTMGVWKAPANVGLNGVTVPSVTLSDLQQESLNIDVMYGKSVNAIRSFPGRGVLVWGARTLDGNSYDWRYINVRRTIIMLEQSIMLATKAYVFENNDPTTWVTITTMIRDFLSGIWKRGGLAGRSPDDAFSVTCGLGATMTAEDILEGILRVTVRVAVTHPAEYIDITFQHQMQTT